MNYLVYAIGAMIAWGFWGFLPRLAVTGLDFSSAQVWNWIGATLFIIPSGLFFGAKLGPSTPSFYYAMLAGVCGSIGGLLYNKSLSLCDNHGATVIAVSALYPVISIALTIVFLKEKLNVWQIVGIVLCISGATILGLSSRPASENEAASHVTTPMTATE